jgi:ATP synthase subunit 6
MFHALEQFEIFVLFSWWASIGIPVAALLCTNFAVVSGFNAFVIRLCLGSSFKKNFNVYSLLVKECYNLVKSIIKRNMLSKRYQYFTTLLFLFGFILIGNLVGLIPYSFTITSSFVVTFFLALSHFIGINIIGLLRSGWKITNLFLPSGAPLAIAPFLIIIEIVSYVARVFSLSIRLFANMMSGHALLKILIGFSWGLLTAGSIYIFISIFPWIIITIILSLEALIAFLQAYVFTILVTIYINDVLVDH